MYCQGKVECFSNSKIRIVALCNKNLTYPYIIHKNDVNVFLGEKTMAKEITLTEFRKNLYRILVEILQTGRSLDIKRKGRTLRITPWTNTSNIYYCPLSIIK